MLNTKCFAIRMPDHFVACCENLVTKIEKTVKVRSFWKNRRSDRFQMLVPEWFIALGG